MHALGFLVKPFKKEKIINIKFKVTIEFSFTL